MAIGRLKTFVGGKALPLWNSSGFDNSFGSFHERLDFQNLAPIDVPRRLMVQCRQIASFARAAVSGWYEDGEPHALRAFEIVRTQYHAADGDPGWIFSLHPNGTIADATRDLYAHAFVLYMLAWVYRLTGDSEQIRLADRTISEVKQIFGAHGQPGLRSMVPGREDLREQNPHMHLFEALLALAEATGAERFLAEASACVKLLDQVLTDPATGTVRELFDAQWLPIRAPGQNIIEPGHQMEWAWLLREWQRLSGINVDGRVRRLVAHATTFGIDVDKGSVHGAVLEAGDVVSRASRIWQQTEATRAFCREDPTGTIWPNLVPRLVDNLLKYFLPDDLNGGWIDQIDENGKPSVDYMPASTLYHLIGAVIDGEAVCSR